MRLNIFNSWKDFAKWSGHVLQYQSTRRGDNFITYIRDRDTEQPITYGLGRTKEDSVNSAIRNIKKINVDGVKQAIQQKRIIAADHIDDVKHDIQWRDGAYHSHKAQKKIVGESEQKDLTP